MSIKTDRDKELRMAQRAIVMQLLRDDHDLLWRRTQLRRRLPDVGGEVFKAALKLLAEEGCIALLRGSAMRASICAQHLDELGLVGI
jgi:hypothetical protein